MDAVDQFFGALPDPDKDHATIARQGTVNNDCYSSAIAKLLKSNSKNPDHQVLLSAAKMFSTCHDGMTIFRQQISKLALSKSVPISMTSPKDRQLQYYRWIAQGRKDGDCPLSPNVQGTRPQINAATHAYLPEKSPKACSNCGKGPDGLIWCSACSVKVHDRLITCTFYCGKQCQEQNWAHHKKVCTARKKLWRAVQLIQALYVKYETYAFEHVLEKLIIRDGILYCIDRSETECVVMGKSVMPMLTRDQAPSEEIFLAAIMASKCADIVTVCKPLLDTLLKPLGLRIEEICVVPRNVHIPVCTIGGKDRDLEQHIAVGSHNLLRVTLPDGEQMAVDFSSPQMGWHETLAPWTVWKENRAVFVVPPSNYGTLYNQESVIVMMMGFEGSEGEKRRKELVAVMDSTIREDMARENMTKATKLFSLDKTQYNSFANSLLSSVENSLMEESQRYAQSRLGLKYYNDAWKACWTLNAAQAAALDDVWLTEEEFQSHGGNERRLKQIWASRCRGSRKQKQFKALGMCMQFK